MTTPRFNTPSLNRNDSAIRNRLAEYATDDASYWSFKGRSTRMEAHALIQYPAMMVPKMQGELIDAILGEVKDITRVFDPFVGSGTTLTETMSRGLEFVGTDINPLAVLVCKVKSGPFYIEALIRKIEELSTRIERDSSNVSDLYFPNIDKWFRADVKIELCKVRRAIKEETSLWARRFFWLTLAEVVRLSSNSRTSTFKLHIKSREDIDKCRVSAISLFRSLLSGNLEEYKAQARILQKSAIIRQGSYQRSTQILLRDVREELPEKYKSDLVVTSPPYGDNKTTVPYGQFSYLPLQWIDLSDIDKLASQSYLESTHKIDSLSVGGRNKDARDRAKQVYDKSHHFTDFTKKLENLPVDRFGRVASFFADLDKSVSAILSNLRTDSYMIWTVGNRRVSGHLVPMDKILTDLLESNNAVLVERLDRSILQKRMAHRNQIDKTMSQEAVLIFRTTS